MGYTRLAAGAHYLTDVAAAAIIGYTAFVTVRFIYTIVISLSEKLSVFHLCRAEASCRLHNLGAEQIIHSGLFIDSDFHG